MPERLTTLAVLTGWQNENARRAVAELGAARERLGRRASSCPRTRPPSTTTRRRSGTGASPTTSCAPPTPASSSAATARSCARSARLLGTAVPTLGVNYGHVGFLASLPHDEWFDGLQAMVAGEYRVVDLLTVDAWVNGQEATRR